MSSASIVSFLNFHAFHFLFVSHSLARISNIMLKRVFNLLPDLIVYNWRRQWHPTPVLLPGKSHGRGSLVGGSPRGAKSWTRRSDFTFPFHFHALQKETATHSSVLAENPRGGGAWWAVVYGVAPSRTRLKRLSSSSSESFTCI